MDGTRTFIGRTWAEWACEIVGHAWDPFADGERELVVCRCLRCRVPRNWAPEDDECKVD